MTVERKPASIPISWVSKEDLLACRPDLSGRIQALDEAEVDYIAHKVGDALQDTYWLALNVVLADYLGVGESPDEGT